MLISVCWKWYAHGARRTLHRAQVIHFDTGSIQSIHTVYPPFSKHVINVNCNGQSFSVTNHDDVDRNPVSLVWTLQFFGMFSISIFTEFSKRSKKECCCCFFLCIFHRRFHLCMTFSTYVLLHMRLCLFSCLYVSCQVAMLPRDRIVYGHTAQSSSGFRFAHVVRIIHI